MNTQPRTKSSLTLSNCTTASLGIFASLVVVLGAPASPAEAAVTGSSVTDGILTITSNHGGTNLRLRASGADTVMRDMSTGAETRYRTNSVRKVIFQGGDGNDRFDAAGTQWQVLARGRGGDDVLIGGDKNDTLIGNSGTDDLCGGNGDDTLVSIDGGTGDVADGQAGRDVYWRDRNGNSTDRVTLVAEDYDNQVAEFANGADRSFDGVDSPANPSLLNQPGLEGAYYRNPIAGVAPLFPIDGPSGTDIKQGGYGDCKIVSALSAVAHNTVSGNAWPVRRQLADFGDGTYGVRMENTFYRVDGQFAYNAGGGRLSPALGPDNSVWVAVAEKAYALHTKTAQKPGYSILSSSSSARLFETFGSADSGTPLRKDFASNPTDLANKLFQKWNGYQNLTLSLDGPASTVDGGHAYTVWNVVRNANGQVTRIDLRNPWGRDGSFNYPAPGQDDPNPDDGIVSMSPQRVWDATVRVNWGSKIS